MSFQLNIKPDNEMIAEYYTNHKHFHEGDAGLDLYCPEDITINPGAVATIDFGISCEANSSYFLVPRSSIAKTPLRMANSIGIIDQGYRGNIMAKVDNIKNVAYTIKKNERLFQLISPMMLPITVKLVQELSVTSRGTGGFGSTLS